MKLKWNFLFVILLLTASMAMLVACGSGKSSSSSSSPAVDDDDTTDDDDNDNDDATPDDDDDNDDDSSPSDDDDDNDDNDDSFAPVTCAIPDPAGIAPNTVGGGAITTQVTAYVYDNATCAPMANGAATVNGTPTDADGKVVVSMTTPGPVTAMATGYWTWSYTANAQVMYFRLQGTTSAATWADSAAGSYQGTGFPLSNPMNPSIGDLLSPTGPPIYLGVSLPGISRNTILATDFNELFCSSADNWDLTYSYNFKSSGGSTIGLPANIYFPDFSVDISLLGYGASANGNHPEYQVPANSAWAQNPLEGFILSAVLGKALSLSALTQLVLAIISDPSNIVADLLPLVPNVINDALAFEYVGVNPTWDGTSAPNLNAVDIVTGSQAVDVTVANPAGGFDYLTLLAGEIPNRAFFPMGMQLATNGAATMAAAPVPDAAYLVATAKTNLLTILGGATENLVIDLALKFDNSLSNLASVSLDNNTDFVADFDQANTTYTNGTVSWALGNDTSMTPDLYVVVVKPKTGETGVAMMPATATSFDAATIFGYTPDASDMVFLGAVKFPTGPTANAYDPTTIVGYDLPAINVWTNYAIKL